MKFTIPSAALAIAMASGAAAEIDPALAALAGGQFKPATSEPAEIEGQVIYIDGLVTIEHHVPTLQLHQSTESVPLGYVPTRDAKQEFGISYGSNVFEMGGRDSEVVALASKQAELAYTIPEDTLLDWPERAHVMMSGRLVVDEAVPAVLKVEASSSAGRTGCDVSLLLDGEEVASAERDDESTWTASTMVNLAVGEYDMVVDAKCAPVVDGNSRTITGLTFSGIYGSDEAEILVVPGEAFAPEVVTAEIADEAPASGVIWSAKAQEEISEVEPRLAPISDPLELVDSFGQHLDFTSETHDRRLAWKALWRPKVPGIYSFAVETQSNICHGVSSNSLERPDRIEGSDIRFVECYTEKRDAYRHPAVALSLEATRRGIISSSLRPHDEGTLRRLGHVEVTAEDVVHGMALAFAAEANIAGATYIDWAGGNVVDQPEGQGVIMDDGATYAEVSGKKPYRSKGFLPTADVRGSMTAQVLVKGPTDAEFRPLSEADTKFAE